MNQADANPVPGMKAKSVVRIGAAVGGTSVVFSLLCFAITPVFTAAILLAALFGATSGGISWALGARRTAWVVFAFALAPLCEFLLMQHVVEAVGSPYLVFLPVLAATGFALRMLAGFLRQHRMMRQGKPS